MKKGSKVKKKANKNPEEVFDSEPQDGPPTEPPEAKGYPSKPGVKLS